MGAAIDQAAVAAVLGVDAFCAARVESGADRPPRLAAVRSDPRASPRGTTGSSIASRTACLHVTVPYTIVAATPWMAPYLITWPKPREIALFPDAQCYPQNGLSDGLSSTLRSPGMGRVVAEKLAVDRLRFVAARRFVEREGFVKPILGGRHKSPSVARFSAPAPQLLQAVCWELNTSLERCQAQQAKQPDRAWGSLRKLDLLRTRGLTSAGTSDPPHGTTRLLPH